jgi:hypothetical protein
MNLKIISALAVGSALALSSTLASADQTTTPPSPYTEKAPGNGPNLHRPLRNHSAANARVGIEGRAAAEDNTSGGGPGFYAGGAARTGYGYSGGVWTGPPNGPYAVMIPGRPRMP